MTELLELGRLLVNLVSVAFAVGSFIYVRIATSKKAAEERVEELEQRLAATEAIVAGLPTRESLHETTLAITKTSGELAVVSERLHGLEKLIDRIDEIVKRLDDYLLHHK